MIQKTSNLLKTILKEVHLVEHLLKLIPYHAMV